MEMLVICFIIWDNTLNISNMLVSTVDTLDIKQFHEIHNKNNNSLLSKINFPSLTSVLLKIMQQFVLVFIYVDLVFCNYNSAQLIIYRKMQQYCTINPLLAY